jgi:hypothetical protein
VSPYLLLRAWDCCSKCVLRVFVLWCSVKDETVSERREIPTNSVIQIVIVLITQLDFPATGTQRTQTNAGSHRLPNDH